MSQGSPSYIQVPPNDTGAKLKTWIISGEHIELVGVTTASGLGVTVNDGLPVRLDSGALVVTPITSGSVIVSGTVFSKISGDTVVVASGNEIIWRNPSADVLTLFSGYGTTNTLVYSGYSTITRVESTIHIYNLTNGSSISYTIRGATLSGSLIYSLTSGTLASGQNLVTTLTDPYSWVDVGIANLQTNFSGAVTVSVVTR